MRIGAAHRHLNQKIFRCAAPYKTFNGDFYKYFAALPVAEHTSLRLITKTLLFKCLLIHLPTYVSIYLFSSFGNSLHNSFQFCYQFLNFVARLFISPFYDTFALRHRFAVSNPINQTTVQDIDVEPP